MEENIDDYYKQIFFYSNEYLISDKKLLLKINFSNRLNLFIFIFLILISQSNTLPIPQINYQQPSLPFPINMPQLSEHSTPYKVYQHHPIPSYSNGGIVQVLDQTNINNQKQFKRERYRRLMIDRMFTKFDEDANGQLSKDELYSLSLRLNIFPKLHYFLKKN